jgi:hypothetical protein
LLAFPLRLAVRVGAGNLSQRLIPLSHVTARSSSALQVTLPSCMNGQLAPTTALDASARLATVSSLTNLPQQVPIQLAS